jgi:hypothetical protein
VVGATEVLAFASPGTVDGELLDGDVDELDDPGPVEVEALEVVEALDGEVVGRSVVVGRAVVEADVATAVVTGGPSS